MPDEVFVEKDFPAAVADSLTSMGYNIKQRGSIGRMELIKIEKKKSGTGYSFESVADKRGDDTAEGYWWVSLQLLDKIIAPEASEIPI